MATEGLSTPNHRWEILSVERDGEQRAAHQSQRRQPFVEFRPDGRLIVFDGVHTLNGLYERRGTLLQVRVSAMTANGVGWKPKPKPNAARWQHDAIEGLFLAPDDRSWRKLELLESGQGFRLAGGTLAVELSCR